MKVLLKNACLYRNYEFTDTDLLLEDGKITRIEKGIEESNAKVYELNGKLVVHNFIDMHTHLRDPGITYKEEISTGTDSALMGGYGSVVAMANTSPIMDSQKMVDEFSAKCDKEAKVNTYTFAAITKGLNGEELVDMESLLKNERVIGFSDDGKGVQNDDMMDLAMQKAHDLDTIIVAHCEDNAELKPGGCVHDGHYAAAHNLVGINNASEYNEVIRDLKLALKHETRFHVCHISTKESVAALRDARKVVDYVSGEVTPHHLVLTEDDIVGEDTNYKMNPPLRSKEDHEALIEGLNDGTLTVISTDHAPHALKDKDKSMTDAAFGIIGLQQAFAVIYTDLVKTNKVKLETVLDALTVNPAEVLRLDCSVEVGDIANICIFDLDEEYEIKEEDIVSKSHNTPFIGKKVYGKLCMNMINGKIMMEA